MSPDIRQVGRDLGVRYVLEGSVRKSADRLRITAQLIDATSGNHVWAERYDRPMADVFAVQDEITESVVASIEPQLLLAEGGRHKRSQPTDLNAWGYVARAFAHRVMASKQEAQVALGFIERALEIDPNYARALAEFAYVTSAMVYSGWREDREQSLEAATTAARKAIALDPDDPFAHAILGVTYRFARRYEEALPEFLKALELNPNHAVAHASLGMALAYIGRPEEGLEHTARALRISPRDPQKYLLLQAQAVVLFAAARYAEAIETAQLARQQRSEFSSPLRILAASFALSGDIARAQVAVRELKRLQPESSLAQVESNADASDEVRGRLLEGLRLAGLQ
jgi:tetratricopeptide (TPR) repeat protein